MLNFLKFIFNPDLFTFYFGGGGGPTTTRSETTNIPDYARQYVDRMMGATEKQIYTYGPKGQITGFQPFTSYSEFDKARGGSGETVAGFSPMQARAMQGIGNYQLPGQTGAATGFTGAGILGSMGAGADYASQATNPYAMQAYMSPYMENALQPQMREAARQSAIEGQRQQAQAVQAGAFGGSRQGLIEAERQRNLAQQQGDIYGRGMQTAFEQARQAQQFGADLGLRGYSQALQGAGQLGALGEQQYKQELGLLGQQLGVGEKQQQYEQNRLNQLIQDYATKQQYPFIQLGTLSNMLRGLPMQASTTQLYQAQPSFLQQGIGLAGAGANLMQAMKAEGGAIKEMASGGIASGVDPYKLPGMMKKLSDDQLKDKMGGDTDPETMGIAQAEKKRRDQVRGMAGGGAVAFAKGGIDEVDNPFEKAKPKEEEKPVAKKEVPAPKAPVAKAPVSATPYQDMARAQLATLDKPVPEVEKTRAAVADLEKRVAGGVEGEMDRRQAAYQKFGVDPIKLIAEERARQQEELKMSEEDYRKSQHLRYAQMFATFGSTPGPVLKAALVAINGVVPDLLDDKAKANAVRRDIKKAMFELDKSEYLEKKGNVDKATEAHESAVARITSLNMDLGKMVMDTELKKTQVTGGLAEREMAGMSAEKTAKIGAGATIESARIREKAQERADIRRETAEARKEEERKSRDTTNFTRGLELNRKNSGYYDKKNDLEQRLAFTKDDKGKEELRKQLQNLINEDRDQQDILRQRYPDARVQEAAPKAAATELNFSSPDIEAIANKYK
jgi:hypothetical protein